MIILAFTDIHSNSETVRKLKEKAKEADLIICTGDISIFQNGLKKVLSEFDSFGKKVLLTHGNHEDEDVMRRECKARKNLVFLHKDFHIHEGILFCAYGGGGFATRDEEFEAFSKKISEKRKGKRLVMLFHQPPAGYNLDVVMGEHVGNESFTEFVIKEKPDLVICGHIHESFGNKDVIGKSIALNPGPAGALIEIK